MQELRHFEFSGVEIEKRDMNEPKIIGYAAVFNQLSEKLGWFREKIQPGAFTESILNDDIRALFNHDTSFVLGRNKASTLVLSEDDRGLKIEIIPPSTTWASDFMVSLQRGDINQMSFGFMTLSDSWETIEGEEVRTLKKAKLVEVSPVTFPAYPQTEVALRSKERWSGAIKPEAELWKASFRKRQIDLI